MVAHLSSNQEGSNHTWLQPHAAGSHPFLYQNLREGHGKSPRQNVLTNQSNTCICSFLHLLVPSFVCLLMSWFVHFFLHYFGCSFAHSFVHSFVCSFLCRFLLYLVLCLFVPPPVCVCVFGLQLTMVAFSWGRPCA